MKRTAAVVIPIYKVTPDNSEIISLRQCIKVLRNHPIYFIAPTTLDTGFYKLLCEQNEIDYSIIHFSSNYFESTAGYNQLLLSTGFYLAFSQFRFILIYQLDAYVFRDELQDWCRYDYDYIGAPWIEGFGLIPGVKTIMGVGNGGFSLRKVSTALRILKRVKTLYLLKTYWDKGKIQDLVKFQTILRSKIFRYIFQMNYVADLELLDLDGTDLNEDLFWCRYVIGYFKDYKIAPVKDALNFSLEMNSRELYEGNNNHIPFGCHAWKKYDADFWTTFIK